MMSSYVPLTSIETVLPGSAKAFSVKGREILLANLDGKFFAIEDRCSHEDSRLSLGCLKGNLISCTLHGSRFCVKTGIPEEEPAVDAVKTFKLRINHKLIEVELT